MYNSYCLCRIRKISKLIFSFEKKDLKTLDFTNVLFFLEKLTKYMTNFSNYEQNFKNRFSALAYFIWSFNDLLAAYFTMLSSPSTLDWK